MRPLTFFTLFGFFPFVRDEPPVTRLTNHKHEPDEPYVMPPFIGWEHFDGRSSPWEAGVYDQKHNRFVPDDEIERIDPDERMTLR